MLRWVPYFTKVEPPSTKMSNFFPLTKRIFVNLDGNLPSSVLAWLLLDTSESIISRIQPM